MKCTPYIPSRTYEHASKEDPIIFYIQDKDEDNLEYPNYIANDYKIEKTLLILILALLFYVTYL